MNVYGNPPPGASDEVIAQRLRDHPCGDDLLDGVTCPCGTTRAVVCLRCGDPVLVAYDPSVVLCRHAVELLAPARRVRPLPRRRRRHRRRRP